VTNKAPTPPPPSQQFPAPQGYPGLSGGTAGQGSGPQDSPRWPGQQPAPGGASGPYGPSAGGQPSQWHPPVPAPRRRRPAWILPAAAGAAVAGAVIAALVISLSPHSSPGATSAGNGGPTGSASPTATPTVGNLQASQLLAGDCLDGSNLQLNVNNSPWPKVVLAVPCSQSHAAEVFYANNNFFKSSGPYPGNSTTSKAGMTACNSAFQAYDGIAFSKSTYSWTDILPDDTTWPNGDRGLHCVAYYSTPKQPGGAPIQGSIKGSRK
jgi:Septum formation